MMLMFLLLFIFPNNIAFPLIYDKTPSSENTEGGQVQVLAYSAVLKILSKFTRLFQFSVYKILHA
jgi:hypothetical protein